MVHAEDDEIIQRELTRLVEEGQLTAGSHALSRPSEAESTAVLQTLKLQDQTTCPLHFVHISTAESVRMIQAAQGRGANVSAETCPHYLHLTSDVYSGERAPLLMVSPPIRSEADRVSLWKGLEDGTLGMMATDHCPFTLDQKTKHADFREIPTGLPGVETTLPLLYTAWQNNGWPLERLVEILSTNAAKRFGLYPRKGSLLAGADADVVVYSPEPVSTIHSEHLHMNVDWTPFEGYQTHGAVRDVLLRGHMLIEKGEWVGGDRIGQFLDRSVPRPESKIRSRKRNTR